HERCPICGTFYQFRFYQYRFDNELVIGGDEDEEILTRLTFTQAKSSLTASEYGAIMRWMPSNLSHPDPRTRRFAAKCLVSHHLERGDAIAMLPYIKNTDPDIVFGALDFLFDACDQPENMPVIRKLIDRFLELTTSSTETVTRWASAIVDRLPPTSTA